MAQQKKKGIEPIFFFPLYPFRAGAFRCIDLTGGKVVSKFGAYHFTPEDFALVKSVAPEAFTNDEKTLDCNLLESIIIREHNVRPQDTKELSCPQILAMLKTIQAKRLEYPGDSDGETGQNAKRIIAGILISLLIICAFVLSVWLIPFTPFTWFRNHPHSYGIQGSIICLIPCLVFAIFKSGWRKWCLGVAGLAFLGVLLSLLGGRSSR